MRHALVTGDAGVRPSLGDPVGHHNTNAGGLQSLVDAVREWDARPFGFASSRSVYGVSPKPPWREVDCVLHRFSPYAASKVAGELLGHVYSYLHGIRSIALRCSTVFGPHGRPALASRKSAPRIQDELPVPVFGDPTSSRDYTFIVDTVAATRAAMDYVDARFEVANLGSGRTVSLNDRITVLEAAPGRTATRLELPGQLGDVPRTWVDIAKARSRLGYRSQTDSASGIRSFTECLRQEAAP